MAFAKKIYLQLSEPDPNDNTGYREMILAALAPLNVRIPLRALKSLYPLLNDSGYCITATLCRSDNGWTLTRVEAGDTCDRLYGIALDIGSTTLRMAIVDVCSGETIAERGCDNSQIALGSNILDRIIAVRAERSNLERLRANVIGDIERLIDTCCAEAKLLRDDIAALTIGGNTTMIHFLLGCDPWQVFQSPYAPVFLDPGMLSAEEVGLRLNCNVFCFPAVANYLGGDITAGLLMTDMDRRSEICAFLDIGTNGELVIGSRDFMIMGAGAAGPALEGAVSESGMMADVGAVCAVRIDENNDLHIETIGNAPPIGICGSGILDLIAQGYIAGWINGNGTMNPAASQRIIEVRDAHDERGEYAICYAMDGDRKLLFRESDVAEYLKCKAAAHTMVATMLDSSGLTADDVDVFYLSGGFGSNYNLESAITVGIYPDIPREKFVLLGNSSLAGAKKYLLDESCRERLKGICQMAAYVQFSEMDTFLSNMVAAQFIPHTNAAAYPSVKRRIKTNEERNANG